MSFFFFLNTLTSAGMQAKSFIHKVLFIFGYLITLWLRIFHVKEIRFLCCCFFTLYKKKHLEKITLIAYPPKEIK